MVVLPDERIQRTQKEKQKETIIQAKTFVSNMLTNAHKNVIRFFLYYLRLKHCTSFRNLTELKTSITSCACEGRGRRSSFYIVFHTASTSGRGVSYSGSSA